MMMTMMKNKDNINNFPGFVIVKFVGHVLI